MGYLQGVAYFILWYSSILGGYAGLFCPVIPLIFVSNSLYRAVTDFLFTFWQMYATALLEILFNCKIHVTGDAINSDEISLLIVNHRTRTDWNFLWSAVYHATRGSRRMMYPTKFVLKDEIRHIPGVGWVMQLACFLYIKRNWAIDKIRLKNMVDYYSSWNYKFSMLIFPEGTDLTEDTKKNSDAYAQKHSLQKYEYVLHPRTTGFAYLAHRLIRNKSLDAIYDVTIIYCDNVPQNEKHLLRGKFPTEVKVHFDRYPVSAIPNSEDDLKVFLERRWQEKERNIREYYTNKHFLHGKTINNTFYSELYLALIFWTLLPPIVLYMMLVWPLYRYIVVGHTVFLFSINLIADGFQNFEISINDVRRRMNHGLGTNV